MDDDTLHDALCLAALRAQRLHDKALLAYWFYRDPADRQYHLELALAAADELAQSLAVIRAHQPASKAEAA